MQLDYRARQRWHYRFADIVHALAYSTATIELPHARVSKFRR